MPSPPPPHQFLSLTSERLLLMKMFVSGQSGAKCKADTEALFLRPIESTVGGGGGTQGNGGGEERWISCDHRYWLVHTQCVGSGHHPCGFIGQSSLWTPLYGANEDYQLLLVLLCHKASAKTQVPLTLLTFINGHSYPQSWWPPPIHGSPFLCSSNKLSDFSPCW